VAYFAASVGSLETMKKFAESLELDYPILADEDGSVARAYGLLAGGRRTPARKTFIIGLDGKLLYIEEKVNTRKHGEQVAKKLEELGVPQARSK